MAQRWRLAPGQTLLHRGWDGQYVVYNSLSGDTHLLTAEAMALLLALRDAEADAAALARRLSLPAADDAADLLADLQELDLVEAC